MNYDSKPQKPSWADLFLLCVLRCMGTPPFGFFLLLLLVAGWGAGELMTFCLLSW